MSKLILSSLDQLFTIFEIDPTLPNPQTCRHEYTQRPIMHKQNTPLHIADDIDPMAMSEFEEHKRVAILRNPTTGATLWAWVKVPSVPIHEREP